MKDYYRILEVNPKATFKEIKKAYKRLAKKYHPDINQTPDAEARFKEVSTAYGVLSSPDHRNQFDAHRYAGTLSQGSFINIIVSDCKECTPTGLVTLTCINCAGIGHTQEKRLYGKYKINSKIICTICNGSGNITHTCFQCLGTGQIKKFK